MTKVIVMSDLHLESSNMKIEKLECDILVLAGDISQDFSILPRFFQYNIPSETEIIYVLGNHEYEGRVAKKVITEIKELEKEFPNLHVLQNEAIEIKGIRFIGTTLWSNFEGQGLQWKKEAKDWCKFNVIDFTYIFKENQKGAEPKYISWKPEDMEKEFNKAYEFLEYELKKQETECIRFVVTHFAPTDKSLDPQYKTGLHSAYWVNNLPELMGYSDYWVHGHTHSSFDYDFEGTRVICNPRGYSKIYDLSQNNEFKKDLAIEIESPQKTKTTKRKL